MIALALFGHTRTLNTAACCTSMGTVWAGQQWNMQVPGTRDAVYGSGAADYGLWSEGVWDQAGVDSGGPVVHVVVGLVASGGPGVDVRYVAGVVGVQHDGYAQQVLA